MLLQDLRPQLMDNYAVRRTDWVLGLCLKYTAFHGWLASTDGGKTWSRETGSLLSPLQLFNPGWEAFVPEGARVI